MRGTAQTAAGPTERAHYTCTYLVALVSEAAWTQACPRAPGKSLVPSQGNKQRAVSQGPKLVQAVSTLGWITPGDISRPSRKVGSNKGLWVMRITDETWISSKTHGVAKDTQGHA